MDSPLSSTLDDQLEELLSLHVKERLFMQEQKHVELLLCVERKLHLAKAIEDRTSKDPALNAVQTSQLSAIKTAALANARIAEKMLVLSKEKIDFIRKLCAPSYGSDGQASRIGGSGGLLDLKA